MTLIILQYCILTGAGGVLLGCFIGFYAGYKNGFEDAALQAADEFQKVLNETDEDLADRYTGVSP